MDPDVIFINVGMAYTLHFMGLWKIVEEDPCSIWETHKTITNLVRDTVSDHWYNNFERIY